MAVDFTKLCDHILAALLYRNWASLTLPSLNSHWMSERLCGRQLWLCAKTALSQRLPSILSLDSTVAPGAPWPLVSCGVCEKWRGGQRQPWEGEGGVEVVKYHRLYW